VTRYAGDRLRPVWVEIDLSKIQANVRSVRQRVGDQVQIMAVVKAEAYGHGAISVARAARDAGATWFGVALPEEGIELREAGIREPILVLGVLQPEQASAMVAHDLTSAICQWPSLEALSREAVRQNRIAKFHLKIDTGMGRVGVMPTEAVDFLRRANTLPGVQAEGVFSHFATADAYDLAYAREQLSRFQKTLASLDQAGFHLPVRHLANSAGIINLPEAWFDMVRLGISLYGLYPSDEVPREKLPLWPAFSLKTRIAQIKRVPPGTGISYGQIYHTASESNIATIPIGYADGWSRMLSGKVSALVHGRRFPIVGRICMDQCMIDLGDEPAEVGDEVVLIGKQGSAVITIDEVAASLGTINYELVCMISDRVPRVYVG
jgi:alanine racemase